MYFSLQCQYPNGDINERKIATTLEKAKEWALMMNQTYPQIHHWFNEVVYSTTKETNHVK